MSERAVPKQRILLRSLAMQLFLNYKTMQGSGYLLSLRPDLRNAEQLDAKAHAAGSFINGHPVFSSAALGALAARLREPVAENDVQEIADWKRSVSTPLGAIGDSLIWERFKPAMLALVVAIMLIASNRVEQWWAWSVVAALVIYNTTLWLFREWAFAQGFRLRERLTELAMHPGLPLVKRGLRILGIGAAALAIAATIQSTGKNGALANLQFVSGFLIMFGAVFLRYSTLTVALLTVLASLGLSFLFQTNIPVLP